MSEPISATPWDLRSGEKWSIQSVDHDIANDRGNETVVDAKGNVVAYVSGNNDEGGNGQLLAAAPAQNTALLTAADMLDKCARYFLSGRNQPEPEELARAITAARVALKQAGAR